jgi:hypothetical protein
MAGSLGRRLQHHQQQEASSCLVEVVVVPRTEPVQLLLGQGQSHQNRQNLEQERENQRAPFQEDLLLLLLLRQRLQIH